MAVKKIILGRTTDDFERFGANGTVFIGKNVVGEGEEAHLANPVYMDVIRPHITLICGKRGSGKSYTAAVIGEGITLLPKSIKKNLSVLMIDTMGIFWSMKRPNEKDRELLEKWGLRPNSIKVKLFAPKKYTEVYKNLDVKVDVPFTLSVSELTDIDWIITFGFDMLSSYGLCITRIIKRLKNKYGSDYSIDDIISHIEREERTDQKVKDALINRFLTAKEWGIFERQGTSITELFKPGAVSVLDISHYARGGMGWSVRSLLIGIISRKIFQYRLEARKREEFQKFLGGGERTIPLVWIVIDEAHQFIPHTGMTVASEPLLNLIKEGREPGISMVLITQMPNKLHPDALSQCDIIISHRLTSKSDIGALQSIMQTYMLRDIQELLNTLPRIPGSAIVLDDTAERIYSIQVRPRVSWHAGGSPSAIEEESLF